MDIDRFLSDPSSAFEHPNDVLVHSSLSRDQKFKVLKRWEYDARELEVAEEENMGGDSPSLLPDILKALRILNAEVDLGGSTPTKQGGRQ